jgi:hypothetical protein
LLAPRYETGVSGVKVSLRVLRLLWKVSPYRT